MNKKQIKLKNEDDRDEEVLMDSGFYNHKDYISTFFLHLRSEPKVEIKLTHRQQNEVDYLERMEGREREMRGKWTLSEAKIILNEKIKK